MFNNFLFHDIARQTLVQFGAKSNNVMTWRHFLSIRSLFPRIQGKFSSWGYEQNFSANHRQAKVMNTKKTKILYVQFECTFILFLHIILCSNISTFWSYVDFILIFYSWSLNYCNNECLLHSYNEWIEVPVIRSLNIKGSHEDWLFSTILNWNMWNDNKCFVLMLIISTCECKLLT